MLLKGNKTIRYFLSAMHNNTKIHVSLIAILTILTRIWYLASPAGRIGDADEAVFGMMAQKIGALLEFPLYCWEADYAGAPVSYIAAFLFHFFGSGFIQLRCAMLPFTLGTILIFYFIYKRLFGPFQAFLGTLLIVFCPFFVLRYTTSALGGYGETFFGTALLILLSWKLTEKPLNPGRRFFILGVVSGFFLYILFLVLPAICAFACAALLSIKNNRRRNFLQRQHDRAHSFVCL